MDTVRITVHLQPGARRSEVVGWDEDALRIRVPAPAAQGRANDALVRLLADSLGIAKSRISIERGATSRMKVIAIQGLTLEEIRRRLADGVR